MANEVSDADLKETIKKLQAQCLEVTKKNEALQDDLQKSKRHIKSLETQLSQERNSEQSGDDVNRALREKIRALENKEKGQLRQRMLGTDEASVLMLEAKNRNLSLFERLATQRSATKKAHDDSAIKDTQIAVLTEHIEKLLNSLKEEGMLKMEAIARREEMSKRLKAAESRVAQLVLTNRKSNKRAIVIDKQDKLLNKQLHVMDNKYQTLAKSHQLTKVNAAKKEKFHAQQLEQISNYVWKTNKEMDDTVTAKTNMLLSSIKLFESVFGGMSCAVLDFQDCQLGNAGIKAISRAIQATVSRQFQLRAAKLGKHNALYTSWKRGGNKPPGKDSSPPDTIPHYDDGGFTSGLPSSILLNVSFNGIGDSGARELAVALAKSKNITEVDLRGNRLTKRSIPPIVDALMYNCGITAVDMSGNLFTNQDLANYVEKLLLRTQGEKSSKDTNLEKQETKSETNDTEENPDENGKSCDSSVSSWDSDDDEFCDSDDPSEKIVKDLPVLSTKDKPEHSIFRFYKRQRPSSAPPRCRTTPLERAVGSFLPRHSFHSTNEPSSHTQRLATRDILRQVEKDRLYPPQKSPYSAVARITLDSISSKGSGNPSRRIKPRPESAMISIQGGQELPTLAAEMAKRVKILGKRPSTAGAGLKIHTSASGKVTYTPSNVQARLRVSTAGKNRPGSSPTAAKTPSPKKESRQRKVLVESPVEKNRLTRSGSIFSRKSFRKSVVAKEVEKNNYEYVPTSLTNVFSYARKGNIGGILNLMKNIEPTPFVSKEVQSFHPNMRQLRTDETALMHAARNGQKAVILLLLEKGADINLVSNEHWSALHHVVDANLPTMIPFLVQYGSKVNIGAGIGDGAAIHLAVRLCKLNAVCQLLQTGCVDIEARDKKNRTALHIAVLTGKVNLAKLLIKHGADPRATDRKGRSAIQLSQIRNDLQMQEVLFVKQNNTR